MTLKFYHEDHKTFRSGEKKKENTKVSGSVVIGLMNSGPSGWGGAEGSATRLGMVTGGAGGYVAELSETLILEWLVRCLSPAIWN